MSHANCTLFCQVSGTPSKFGHGWANGQRKGCVGCGAVFGPSSPDEGKVKAFLSRESNKSLTRHLTENLCQEERDSIEVIARVAVQRAVAYYRKGQCPCCKFALRTTPRNHETEAVQSMPLVARAK